VLGVKIVGGIAGVAMRLVGVCLLAAMVAELGACSSTLPVTYSTVDARWLSAAELQQTGYAKDSIYCPKGSPGFVSNPNGRLSYDAMEDCAGVVKPGFITLLQNLHDDFVRSAEPTVVALEIADESPREALSNHPDVIPKQTTPQNTKAYVTAVETKIPDPSSLVPPACVGKSPKTDYGCWAATHPRARRYTDAITDHAINQCVTLVGRQNSFQAKYAAFILPFHLASSAALDVAALVSKSSTNVALGATAVAANAPNLEKAAPSTVSYKASDTTAVAQAKILVASFDDADECCFVIGTGAPPHGPNTVCGRVFQKYSKFHDSLLASCPANNW